VAAKGRREHKRNGFGICDLHGTGDGGDDWDIIGKLIDAVEPHSVGR
jgi:hypothetical protein